MAAEMSRSGRALAVLQLASIVAFLLSSPRVAAAELSADFHATSCPQLEHIVQFHVEAALRQEIAIAAGLIRIFFHDCFPQGCDASVYLSGTDPTNTERFPQGPNETLQPRALQLVETIRAAVHASCGPTVSCADISNLATRAAIVASGGPSYELLLGQMDSLAPAPQELVFQLPAPFLATIPELLAEFANRSRGLGDVADLVALSGGHTVGRARCGSFQDRADKQEDTFSKKLKVNCTRDVNRLQNLDVITPDLFDNSYYIALTFNQGVFTSDMALIRNRTTARIVKQFAADKTAFFDQFARSMFKLSKVPRIDGNKGEIRNNCFSTNKPRLVEVTDAGSEIEEEAGFAASA